MKKLLAVALSVIMSAAIFTACGDDDSSSKKSKDSSSATSSAAADDSKADASSDSEADADSDADASSDDNGGAEVTGDGALTKAYTEKMKSGKFSLGMKAEVMGMETEMGMAMNGEDFFVSLDLFGEKVDVYKVGEKVLAVLPNQQKYAETTADQIGSILDAVSTYSLDENAEYLGTTEEDGFTVESFKIPAKVELGEGVTMDSDTDLSTESKYYFDADGNLKKIVSSSSLAGDTTVEITSLSFDDVTIELPDVSGYEEVQPDALVGGGSEEVESADE